jgi:hypothetical protein
LRTAPEAGAPEIEVPPAMIEAGVATRWIEQRKACDRSGLNGHAVAIDPQSLARFRFAVLLIVCAGAGRDPILARGSDPA